MFTFDVGFFVQYGVDAFIAALAFYIGARYGRSHPIARMGTARVAIVPGRVRQVPLNNNDTVGQLLSFAGLSGEGQRLYINGVIASLDSLVRAGDTVLVTLPLRGN